jgi:ubiquinone/menaquinone biosynthesis C-methylase UbiE
MKSCSIQLIKRYYDNREHPYQIYERTVLNYIDEKHVLLDVGCGRTAPILQKLAGQCHIMIGLDISGFEKIERKNPINLIISDVGYLGLKDNSVDIIISRSLLEHTRDITKMYKEISRILKPNGYFIFLTPNLFDYGSLISKLIPNRFHPYLVRMTEGRDLKDTFPTFYKSNTQGAIKKFSKDFGFKIEQILFLGQYPSYLIFNPLLFLLGSGWDRLLCKFEMLRFLRSWILAVLQKKDKSVRNGKTFTK